MAKQFLRTTLFFLIFLLLFAGFSHLLVPKNNSAEAGIHDDWAKGFLAEPEDTIDVLILGDSEVYSCVAPLLIWQNHGITSYSCGTSDQKLYQTESYLQRFFETQNPKIVLLETNILYRDYSTTSIIPHLFEEAFPLVRYHDRWKRLSGADLTQGVEFTHIQQHKGYMYLTDILPADDSNYMAYTDEWNPIPGKSVRHVNNILKFCQEHGARLILFSSPSTANWDYLRHNATQALAWELDLEYLDMNLMREEIPIDWQVDTRDHGDHLNHTGAEKLTLWLGQYLEDMGIFRDKRAEDAYADWNVQLQNFLNNK